jgi:ribosomal protein S18 acetylase RimI-like enzyme
MNLSIRAITPGDGEAVEALYRQSVAILRSIGDSSEFRFNAEIYRRDGFGDRRAFSGIVAVLDGEVVGYLLYSFGYDTDQSMRNLFVVDLCVDESVRGRGIGKTLMASVAEICRAAGGGELVWAVHAKNSAAIGFYRRIGADFTVDDLRFMTLRVQPVH